MGRKSDYSIKNEQENIENFKQRALGKFSKENVNPREFALICENKFSEMTFDEKTIRNNIRKLCQGKLKNICEEDFKDKKGNYSIPPKIQPAFMALIAFSMIDGRKRHNDFSKEEYIDIIDIIEKYFSDDDKKALQMIPLYKASIREYNYMRIISQDLSQLLTYASESEPTIRVFLLDKVSKKIKKLKKKIYKKSSRAWVGRYIFGTDNPEAITIRKQISQNDMVESLFFSRKWRDVFSKLIIVRLNEIKDKNKDDCETLSSKIDQISRKYQYTLKEKNIVNDVEKKMESPDDWDNSQEYEGILNKIKGVLNPNNLVEDDIIHLIEKYFDMIKDIERESSMNYKSFLKDLHCSYNKEEVTFEDSVEVLKKFCRI